MIRPGISGLQAGVEVKRLSDLPTVAEMRARGRATPKPSKLDRAKENGRRREAFRLTLSLWALAVKNRDRWRDRYDGKPVERTLDLVPRRAEAHHVVSREDAAVRYDTRNGICLSYETHARVERNELRIVGTKFFSVKGSSRRYIDATYPVRVDVVKEKR